MSEATKNRQSKKGGWFGPAIITPAGTAAFPKLARPDVGGQYSDEKYKTYLLFDEGTDLSALKKACAAVAKDAFGGRGITPADVAMPFRDGDQKANLEGFAGRVYIQPKCKQRPGVVGADKRPIDGEEIYSGAKIRLSVTPASYEQTLGGKKIYGVTLYLNHVQKLADGERLGGGGGSAENAFDEWDNGDTTTAASSGWDEDTIPF